MLDFVQVNYQWTMPIPAGPSFSMTDFPQAPGHPDAVNHIFPDWLPFPNVFIVHARARLEQAATGQIGASIDHNRRAYDTGSPPYHQAGPFPGGFGDFSQCETLISLPIGYTEIKDSFWPPKVLNRVTDSIWLQNDNQGPGIFTLDIGFIIPATVQPTGLNTPAPPPPPEPGWQIVAQVNPDGEVAYGGYTFSSALDSIVSGGEATRLTIAAGSTGCTLNSLYVGPRSSGHSAASLASVLPSPVSIAANGQHVVEIPSALSGAMIVRGYVAAGKLRSKAGAVSGWSSAYKAGDFASALDGSTFTTGTAASNGLTRIEKFYP